MKKCNIIIPIYNAYDCLEECIESVIKNTDLAEDKIILINDKSTDDRVDKLLSDYAKKYNYIIYLKNEQNLGFVGTVNKGMKYSKEDVLLLNSDTIVSENWLKKIKDCAYSDTLVATVTPLSNNATLASVPVSFEENELFPNKSFEETAKIIESGSQKLYPELPTGHGFCLYIKRDALNNVGYFDEEKFGKGYGEENDFCFRCLDLGYKHLLCDDTYIFHKESQSFSDKKIKLIESGTKILMDEYPNYMKQLNIFCASKDISYIGDNVVHSYARESGKKNILFVIHDWNDISQNLGGTSLHAYDIITNLKNNFNFHVLSPTNDGFSLFSYVDKWETIIKYPKISTFNNLNFYSNEYEQMLDQIVTNFGISIIHIHHLKGSYFNLKNIIKKHNLYSIMSLHDFYPICPLINKLYNNKEYCGDYNVEKCGNCLTCAYNRNHNLTNTATNWNHNWNEFLKTMNQLIAPSKAAKDEFLMTYKDLRIDVIEHGVDVEQLKKPYEINIDSGKDIAFVGAIGAHKGSKRMYEMTQSKNLKKIKIHLFGICDNPQQKNTRHFIMHGKYLRKDLPQKLQKNNIKLVCLFSIWPETYSYTLTEVIAAGVPVIATNLGAVAERVEKYGLGWIVDYKIPTDELINKINNILSDKDEYQKILTNIKNYKIKSTAEMSIDYKKIYMSNGEISKEYKTDEIFKAICQSKHNNGVVHYSNYEWIFSTLKWKIISKLKIPKSIKNAFRKAKKDD